MKEEKFEVTTTLLFCGHFITVTTGGLFMVDGKSIFHPDNEDKGPFGWLCFSAGEASQEQIKYIHEANMEYFKPSKGLVTLVGSNPREDAAISGLKGRL